MVQIFIFLQEGAMFTKSTLIKGSNNNFGMRHNWSKVRSFDRTVSLTNADRALFSQTDSEVMALMLTICGKSRC